MPRSSLLTPKKAAAKEHPASTLDKLRFQVEDKGDNSFTIWALPKGSSERSERVGYIYIGVPDWLPEEQAEDRLFVSDVGVEDEWRGTGLGQKLYDLAIEEAGKRGASFFIGSTEQTGEAKAAWKRIGKRYKVVMDVGIPTIDLRSRKYGAGSAGIPWENAPSEYDISHLATDPELRNSWLDHAEGYDLMLRTRGKVPVVMCGVDELDSGNETRWNDGGQETIDKIKRAIESGGNLPPLLVNDSWTVLDGNHRLYAAKEMGVERVPCVFLDDACTEKRKGKRASATRWYHGTPAKNLKAILAAGIVSPNMPKNGGPDPQKGAVYVTSDPVIAQHYADGGEVLRVDVKASSLIPDEDSLGELLESGELNGNDHYFGEVVAAYWLVGYEGDPGYGGSRVKAIRELAKSRMHQPMFFSGLKRCCRYLASSKPELARQIIEDSGKAAHLGPVKVLGVLGDKTTKQAMPLSEQGKAYLRMADEELLEFEQMGDYEFFVTRNERFDVTQIGLQRVGSDAFDVGQQERGAELSHGGFPRKEVRSLIRGWLAKYGDLIVQSHNTSKQKLYEVLLQRLGFTVKAKQFPQVGMAFPVLSAGSRSV